MQIKDIMATDVRACTPETNLATAGAIMVDADCGFLAVVADGRLVYQAICQRRHPTPHIEAA